MRQQGTAVYERYLWHGGTSYLTADGRKGTASFQHLKRHAAKRRCSFQLSSEL